MSPLFNVISRREIKHTEVVAHIWRQRRLEEKLIDVYRVLFWSDCCLGTKSCLWDTMGCSPPGFPVLHHLLEFAQTHVH